jgi:prefoldin subunit 5
LSQEQQVDDLKGEAAWLQEQLEAVNQQIEEIAG